ncbi:hypothetical protein JCM18899A_41080 [Nocardioides sp. AN3]
MTTSAHRALTTSAWTWLRGAGAAVLAIAALEYGVIPFLARARHEASVLDEVSWPLLLVAGALEAASLAAYTGLTQSLLESSVRLGFGVQWRIDLAGCGLSHAVPGGGATGAGLRVRLMVGHGVASATALALTVVQLALSVSGLMTVWLLGVLMAVPRTGVTTTVVALVLTTTAVLLALEVAPRRPQLPPRLRRIGSRALQVLPVRWRSSVRTAVVSGARWLRDSRLTRRGIAWASTNWLLDAICLWVSLRAFGATVPVELVLASYGLANMLAFLPLTPSGIGIVEGLLVPAMAAAGAPAAVALAGVLTWRLLQFWLPIPIGAVCWASLLRPSTRV